MNTTSLLTNTEGYHLKMSVRDVEYDPAERRAHHLKMLTVIRPLCENPVIVNERVVRGKTPIGFDNNRYFMDIKCHGSAYGQ